MREWVLAAMVLAASPAWADTPAPGAPKPQGGEKAPAQSVWKTLSGGEVQHLQSGLRCPMTLGGEFRQAGVTTFDGFGLDVGCGYNSRAVAVTLYLTRGIALAEGYAIAKTSLSQAREGRNPRLLADGRVSLGGVEWLRASFAEDGGVRTDVWMADLHGWSWKYRTTYREQDEAETRAALERLTALVQATAGAHLALCAKSQVPERPGKPAKPGRGGQVDGIMGALLGGISAAADDTGQTPVPITFCVEEPLRLKTMDFLTWHGVTPEGADARADRLTGMTVGPPPVLDIALDEAGSTIAAELTGKTVERWTATVTQGRNTLIYGHFERRPSGKLAAHLMARILTGKARSLGGYDAETKTISVTTP